MTALEPVGDLWDLPEPCQYGMSGHCSSGSHRSCAANPGGPHEHGLVVPSGWLTDRHGRVFRGDVEVGPWHTWRCPCPCHGPAPAGQLDLFPTITKGVRA
jgi:hypothetical protein